MRPGFINSFRPNNIAAAIVSDPLWDNVVLDASMNGSTPTDFQDYSPYARPMLSTGGTPRLWGPVCGDGALNVSSSLAHSYLSTTSALGLGSGNFTIECWVNFTSAPAGATIPTFIGQAGGSAGDYSYALYQNATTGNLVFQWSTNGSTMNTVSTAWSPVVGQWYHVAAERNGSTLTLYIDGAVATTAAISGSLFAAVAPTRIGGIYSPITSSAYFPGFLSSLRVTAAARYAGAFSPACPVSGASDPLWASVLLYMPFNSSSGLTDQSTFARTFTSTGFPSVTTGACGTKLLALQGPGSSEGLQIPWPECRLALENKDFTMEAFVNFFQPPAAGTFPVILSQRTSDQNNEAFVFYYDVNAGALRFIFNTNGAATRTVYSAAWVPTFGTWYHVAVSRSAGNLLLFVDGVLLSSTAISGSMFDSTARMGIGTGGTSDSSVLQFPGAIDALRVYKGVAKYTSSFAVSCPLPAPAPTPGVLSVVAATGYGEVTFADFVDGASRAWRVMGVRHTQGTADRPLSVLSGMNAASATRQLLRVVAAGYGGGARTVQPTAGGGGGGRTTGVGNASTLPGVNTGNTLLLSGTSGNLVWTTAGAAVTVQAGSGGLGGDSSGAPGNSGGSSFVAPLGALNAQSTEVSRGGGGGGGGQLGGLGGIGGSGATANGGNGGNGNGGATGGGGGVVGNGAPGTAGSNVGGNGGTGLALPALEQLAVAALLLQDATWSRMASPMGGGGGGGGNAVQGVGVDGGGDAQTSSAASTAAKKESSGQGGRAGGVTTSGAGRGVLMLAWPKDP